MIFRILDIWFIVVHWFWSLKLWNDASYRCLCQVQTSCFSHLLRMWQAKLLVSIRKLNLPKQNNVIQIPEHLVEATYDFMPLKNRCCVKDSKAYTIISSFFFFFKNPIISSWGRFYCYFKEQNDVNQRTIIGRCCKCDGAVWNRAKLDTRFCGMNESTHNGTSSTIGIETWEVWILLNG